MTTIAILGAHGATAQIVTQRLIQETHLYLRLYLRRAERLASLATEPRVSIIAGNVQDPSTLQLALKGVDLVYSNIGGVDLAISTKLILDTMQKTGCQRLLFYSALGALHEVPGQFGTWNETAIADYLPGFRLANQLIEEQSQINTTQFRPAWLTNKDEIDYEITSADEPFRGTEVSRQSVADFVVRVIKNPTLYPHTSVGLNKPHTAGNLPAWLQV